MLFGDDMMQSTESLFCFSFCLFVYLFVVVVFYGKTHTHKQNDSKSSKTWKHSTFRNVTHYKSTQSMTFAVCSKVSGFEAELEHGYERLSYSFGKILAFNI